MNLTTHGNVMNMLPWRTQKRCTFDLGIKKKSPAPQRAKYNKTHNT